MNAETESRVKMVRSQDDCWELGYTSGQWGEPKEVPANVAWADHWLAGYDDAVEDIAKKRK